jgi:hypothetical protein
VRPAEPTAEPDAILADIEARLAAAVGDRRRAWRTPTLATIGLDGGPRARTVVLRGVDAACARVSFHSDRRSAKCDEIAADGRACLHFYDAEAKLQLRLEGHAVLHCADAMAEAAWRAARLSARRTYAIEPGPGAFLDGPDDATFSADAPTSFARFVVVELAVATIEWLHLRAEGHRRLLLALSAEPRQARWRAP